LNSPSNRPSLRSSTLPVPDIWSYSHAPIHMNDTLLLGSVSKPWTEPGASCGVMNKEGG
jgi:hypothetical protein